MLRIPCPYCGERDRTEFVYGGDASAPWPADPVADDTRERDLYRRANPAGLHLEYWQHARGCRQWLRLTRDTVRQEIESARGHARVSARADPEGSP